MRSPATRRSMGLPWRLSRSEHDLCMGHDRRPLLPQARASNLLWSGGRSLYRYLRYVPKNQLSRMVGRLVHVRMPRPIARRVVQWFARTYQIDVNAAGKPLDQYPSIGHFFVRDLAVGLRPIEGDFVSPVDGTLRNFGVVSEGRIEQVKGKSYTLVKFLGDDANAKRYENG